jgi:Large ribosomal RNA subunit accumulation protein YceD
MPGELSWDHLIEDIPPAGLSVERVADAEERERLKAALDLGGLPELRARYQITPLSFGRHKLVGELAAVVDQTCVVSLEPVRSEVADTYAATYWPAEAMPEPAKGQVALDAEPDPEAIVDGRIDVGRIVFESLAAAIDPFPRVPGAVFDGPLSTPAAQKSESPFAVLASLKDKR